MKFILPGCIILGLSGFISISYNRDNGYKPLFNGRDFTGWNLAIRSGDAQEARKVFAIEHGMVHVFKNHPDSFNLDKGKNLTHGLMYTKKEYERFSFRFEYKWGTKVMNNFSQFQYDAGMYYHVYNDKIWPYGLEYQIRYNHLENRNHTGDYWAAKTGMQWYSADGETFSLPADGGQPQPIKNGEHRAKRDAPFHALDGQWNQCEVIVMGDQYSIHKLNGEVVNMATDLSVRKGIIGLQSETAEIYYRNIEIKEFKKFIPAKAFLK